MKIVVVNGRKNRIKVNWKDAKKQRLNLVIDDEDQRKEIIAIIAM